MSAVPLHLMTHPEPLVIARLDSGEEPSWEWSRGPFASLTRSADETSIVCLEDVVPVGVTTEGPFLGVEVAGPLAFEAVGVMAEILTPLVPAGISVLAMSTFDTDWVLVPAAEITTAMEVWRKAGLIVTSTTLSGRSGE
ncbi:amino acid-binding protein [Knoellia sinensis KCTC 19936]|uniref:Amino acid-binding protein n=1 Tax=Knoellia sinensis KCTC 19936 TaxID=1385520 RepID=A0A0A0JEU0_9MICO|nr:ACT domain-containing protein [Knoellia sinensis]KGN34537.1 amino acid-binding protein [Knoellia sinensis KCTC 19936]